MSENNFSRKRQREIYIPGLGGLKPAVPVSIEKLAQVAEQKMTPAAYAYVASGAGIEDTVRENQEAFRRWRIVPRMLNDVSAADTSIELFGSKLSSPFLLAPIGVLEVAHPQADKAVGKAAAAEKIPFIVSGQASVPMEDIAEEMGDGTRWFQLYWSTMDDLVVSLVERAEKAGYTAIVLTLDTTLPGWRIRDLDYAQLPFLQGKGIAQYTSDPAFQKALAELDEISTDNEKPKPSLQAIQSLWSIVAHYPGNPVQNLRSGEAMRAVRKFISVYSRSSLTWDDLSFLRALTRLPILLKGILHPDDALKAIEAGMDGIIVSNHGGRQVDGAIASLSALPDIVQVVNGEIPVLLDSGIRTGADIFKALALGADAVCLGRPYVYGLAAGGYVGVKEVLRNYKADFELTMRLAGCRSVEEITADSLRQV